MTPSSFSVQSPYPLQASRERCAVSPGPHPRSRTRVQPSISRSKLSPCGRSRPTMYICVCSEQSASRKMRVPIRRAPNQDLAQDAKLLAAIVAGEANGQKESTHLTFLLKCFDDPCPRDFCTTIRRPPPPVRRC